MCSSFTYTPDLLGPPRYGENIDLHKSGTLDDFAEKNLEGRKRNSSIGTLGENSRNLGNPVLQIFTSEIELLQGSGSWHQL